MQASRVGNRISAAQEREVGLCCLLRTDPTWSPGLCLRGMVTNCRAQAGPRGTGARLEKTGCAETW